MTRQYLIAQAVIGALVNFVLNGALAWLLYRPLVELPLTGDQSIAGDTAVTSFLLPLLIALIVTPLVRKDMQAGRATALPRDSSRLPTNPFLLGLVLGLIAAILLTPLIYFLFHAFGIETMAFWPFILFKAAFAAILAAFITPLVAKRALTPRR